MVGRNHRDQSKRGGSGGLSCMMRRLVRASVTAAPAESVGVLASHGFWDRLREVGGVAALFVEMSFVIYFGLLSGGTFTG